MPMSLSSTKSLSQVSQKMNTSGLSTAANAQISSSLGINDLTFERKIEGTRRSDLWVKSGRQNFGFHSFRQFFHGK